MWAGRGPGKAIPFKERRASGLLGASSMARSPTQGLEAECPLQAGQPPAWVQSLAECPWPRQVPEPVPAPSRGSHNAFLSWAERVRRVMTYGMHRAQLKHTFRKCSNSPPGRPCTSVSRQGPFCPGEGPGLDSTRPHGQTDGPGRSGPWGTPLTLCMPRSQNAEMNPLRKSTNCVCQWYQRV